MATLSIAQDKGGPGKTTLCCLLAVEWVLDGYKVGVIDTDTNQQAASFADKAKFDADDKKKLKDKMPSLKIYPDVREDGIVQAIQKAEAENDIVIVDLPGGSSTLAIKALCLSHLVLVPSQPNLPDVNAAMKTIGQIDDAQAMMRVPIARAFVWTRFKPGYESRPARHVRETVEAKKGVPILKCALMERAAFSEIHITGQVPRQGDSQGGPALNLTALAQEILARVDQLSKAA